MWKHQEPTPTAAACKNKRLAHFQPTLAFTVHNRFTAALFSGARRAASVVMAPTCQSQEGADVAQLEALPMGVDSPAERGEDHDQVAHRVPCPRTRHFRARSHVLQRST